MALKGTLAKIDGAGTNSVALGQSSSAAGNYSVAVGYNARATAVSAVAIGTNTSSASVGVGTNCSAQANGVAIGQNAGAAASATAIGFNAKAGGQGATAIGAASNAAYSGSTALGYLATAPSANTIMLGSSSVGNVYMKGSTSNVVTSDILDKTDIETLEDGALNLINQIQPITYYYNYRTDYQNREQWTSQQIFIDDENLTLTYEICNISKKEREKRYKYGGLGTYDKEAWEKGEKKKDRMQVGFKAQEVQQILQNVYNNKYLDLLVDDICKEYSDEELEKDSAERQYGLAEGDLIPFLVKAIQELDTRISFLKNEILKKVN